MGSASYPTGLEKIRRHFAIFLDYDRLPCDLVGSGICGNRLDVFKGFGAAGFARAFWGLCDAKLPDFSQIGRLAICLRRPDRSPECGNEFVNRVILTVIDSVSGLTLDLCSDLQ